MSFARPAVSCLLDEDDRLPPKLATSVGLARRVIRLFEDTSEPDIVDSAMQALLRDLEGYRGSMADHEMALIFSTSRNLLGNDFLQELSCAAVPVAILREVLSVKKVMFNPRAVPAWETFSDRYEKWFFPD